MAAAATPTPLAPTGGAVVRLGTVLRFQWTRTPLTGAEVLTGVHLQVATATGGGFAAAIVYDSLLRAPDLFGWSGEDDEARGVAEIWPEDIGLIVGQTYYWRVAVLTDATTVSAWPSDVSFAVESKMGKAAWVGAQ
jgi:hypothetical protein